MPSLAKVATNRAARYGKQLVSHMSRKIEGEWDGEHGKLVFPNRGEVTLTSHTDHLLLTLTCNDDDRERLEHVVGIHLARFGAKDQLVVTWERSDASAGTQQGPLTEADLARMAADKARRQSPGV
ncbi:DUF2218 domain-containing protein [Arcanobacterium haemolyticum]|nr:DUF2218 domain-containing protein [Arcanobacterium haemolyticum]